MYRQDATLSTSSTFLLHQSAQTGCHDALGNSALLLKSVENVYTKSMSQEESLQKLMREKERADDAQHRQKQENAKLREQLVTERGIRSADTSVKHEIAQHKLMMQQIMEQQGEVKSMHKKESTRVKHLQQSTAHHKALFLRMQKDLQWVQEKQADRKQLKKQNHELQLRLSTMEGKLRDAQQKTSALEQSSSRHDAEAQAQQKEGERVKDRLENALREAQLQASVHERLAKVACEEADTELERAGELCARWEDEHKEKVGSPAFSLLAAPAKRVRPPPPPPPLGARGDASNSGAQADRCGGGGEARRGEVSPCAAGGGGRGEAGRGCRRRHVPRREAEPGGSDGAPRDAAARVAATVAPERHREARKRGTRALALASAAATPHASHPAAHHKVRERDAKEQELAAALQRARSELEEAKAAGLHQTCTLQGQVEDEKKKAEEASREAEVQKRAAAAAASKLADAEAAHVHAQTDRTRRDAEADAAAKEAAERIRMLEREKAEAAASVLSVQARYLPGLHPEKDLTPPPSILPVRRRAPSMTLERSY